MENACWVCNNPIDKTKPIKPLMKDDKKKDDEGKKIRNWYKIME
ncbi:MAG: hypothetical protein ACFFKA_13920 [Candidatus Thorarchaeota archaeon]